MDPPVVAALVAGGFAIVGPVVTFVMTKAYERRFLEPMAPDRRKALVGRWHGAFSQHKTLSQLPLTATLEMELKATRKAVTGNADVTFTFEGKEHFLKFSLVGGFLHDRFLKLDYKNTNPGTIQFGSIVLDLAANANTLTGRYLGYGSIMQAIVSGDVALDKRAL